VAFEQVPGDRKVGLRDTHRFKNGSLRTRQGRSRRQKGTEQGDAVLSGHIPCERADQIAAFLEGCECVDGNERAAQAVIVNLPHGGLEASDQIQVAFGF
jgi:hypothetical protein